MGKALELTDEAVRQRLSRGRKLLAQELATFVEQTLGRTAPGRSFTIAILAALPAFAVSASAATAGATAAKGSAAAGSAGALSALAGLLGPVIGIAGAYFGVKASLDATRTPRERAFTIQQTKIVIAAVVLFNVAILGFIFFGIPRLQGNPILWGAAGMLIIVGFAAFIAVSALRWNRRFIALREEELRLNPGAFAPGERTGAVREYKSKASFLGLPLVHVRHGRLIGQPVQPAVGWIAIGDKAYGILFAAGGVALGSIAVGGICFGLLAMGGLCLGLVAVGGLAIGGFAFGGAALGIVAIGGFAAAYYAAEGGFAVAREFALGGQAFARHANDAAAREILARLRWLDFTRPQVRNWFMLISWLPMVFVFFRARHARKAQAQESGG